MGHAVFDLFGFKSTPMALPAISCGIAFRVPDSYPKMVISSWYSKRADLTVPLEDSFVKNEIHSYSRVEVLLFGRQMKTFCLNTCNRVYQRW